MDFYDAIRRRRSVRAYRAEEVEDNKLERLCEAVRLAPTACNLQPFRFLIVKHPEKKALLAEVYPQPWFKAAPIIVVALGNRDQAWKRRDGSSAHVIDVSIAMEHLVLAAAAEGLATCWIAAFDQRELQRKMGIGNDWEVVAMTPLGYPETIPEMPGRKTRDDLFAVI